MDNFQRWWFEVRFVCLCHNITLSSYWDLFLPEQLTSHLSPALQGQHNHKCCFCCFSQAVNWKSQNKERMHLQQSSIITTHSQQVSSRLHCERKSTQSESRLHISILSEGSATKMTLILTPTWKRMRSGTYMPAVKIGTPKVADCLHHIVISVCMRCGVFVCVCMHV